MNSKSVYSILRRHLRNRLDLGMGKAMLETVLNPANPFDTRVRRTTRRWLGFFIFVGERCRAALFISTVRSEGKRWMTGLTRMECHYLHALPRSTHLAKNSGSYKCWKETYKSGRNL